MGKTSDPLQHFQLKRTVKQTWNPVKNNLFPFFNPLKPKGKYISHLF
jgi:hypothetical protein